MRQRFALAAVLLAGCSTERAKVALNEPTIDTLAGGVVRVTNTGPTAWPDTAGWRLVEERVIAPAEGSPGEFSEISGVVADAAGNVFVFQRSPALVRVYGPDGVWRRDIGREGDGPGEYRGGMFGIHGDTLFVQDPNNTRLTTFLTSGTFIASHPSQCCWWTSTFLVFDDGTVGIMGPPPASAKDRQGALYLTHLNGIVTDTILLPVRNDSPDEGWTVTRTSGQGRSMMDMNIPLKPSDMSVFRANRQRINGNTAVYQLAITGLRDDTLRLFTAPAPTLTITELQRDSIFDEEMAGVNEQWRDAVRAVAKKSDIPSTWPLWSNVMVDGHSRIWVARPGPRGAVSTLDVFTSEGILLGEVPAPPKFEMRGHWVGDRLYQQSESDDGLPQVKVYRVKTP